MAFWIIPVGILGAIVVGLFIYLIIKYATKSKSYDEAMAEQRRLERNLRFKLKHHPKKLKNENKENLKVEKRNNKTVLLQTAAIKDTQKVETSENNPVVCIDEIGNEINSTKKKNESSLLTLTNTMKSFTENSGKDVRLHVRNINIKKQSVTAHKNDNLLSSSANNNSRNKNAVDVSKSNTTTNIEKQTLLIKNPFKMNKTSSAESSGSSKSETPLLSNLHEKRDSKKNTLKKKSDEVIGKTVADKTIKSSRKEKGTSKEMKSKQKEAKSGHSQDIMTKHDEVMANEKTPPSHLAENKKIENNGENQAAADTVDTVSVERNAIKEMVITKVDKLTVAVSKKNSVHANSKIPNGKTTSIVSSKGQKSSINLKSSKNVTKGDIKTLYKLNNENCEPVSVSLLMPLIAKAELSRSDYQNLIELLLNKLQENCIDAEWIESGRQDPMVKLKKQLAEKEKALSDEQETHQAIQSKLKELRAELNTEKHTNRQLEETLNTRQMDLQAVNARLQSAVEEKQSYLKQLQQLQNKFKEERAVVNSLKDEHSKIKNNLQHELLSQRQQLELHIAHLNEQHQQEVLALETQLNQLASQLQEQETTNAQMTDEIRECVLIRERLVHQESQIAHLQQTVIKLEELRPIKVELERHVTNNQFEMKRLNKELQSLTDQLNRKNVEIEKFNHTVQNIKIENQELMMENSRNNEQIKFASNEKAQLQIENEKLRNELQKLNNECHSHDDIVRLKSELESYRNTLVDKNTEIKLLNEHVAVMKNSEQEHLSRSRELEEEKRSTKKLKEALHKQIRKNEDLRNKNWKVMETLTSVENSLESKMKEMQYIPHEIKRKEREFFIQHLNNILPVATDISISHITDDEVWSSKLESILQKIYNVRQSEIFSALIDDAFVSKEVDVNMLDELEKQNKQLQSMVGHYKNIISDTEGMLNSLQNHVELEENRWSEQVQVLQAELKAVTEERNSLLQKLKIQKGCVQNDVCSGEYKINGIDKHSSLPPSSLPLKKQR